MKDEAHQGPRIYSRLTLAGPVASLRVHPSPLYFFVCLLLLPQKLGYVEECFVSPCPCAGRVKCGNRRGFSYFEFISSAQASNLDPNTIDLSGSVQRRGWLVDAEFDNRAGGSMGDSGGRSPYILQVFMITGNGEACPGIDICPLNAFLSAYGKALHDIW